MDTVVSSWCTCFVAAFDGLVQLQVRGILKPGQMGTFSFAVGWVCARAHALSMRWRRFVCPRQRPRHKL